MKIGCGAHIAAYYCDTTHLAAKLLPIILRAAREHAYICMSASEDVYQGMTEALGQIGLPQETLHFSSVLPLIEAHRQGGLLGLETALTSYEKEALSHGFQMIIWIGQPSDAIEKTSKDLFLQFEADLSKAIKHKKIAAVCIYDFNDFISIKRTIDDDVMSQSQKTHSRLLYGSHLLSMNRVG